MCDCQNKEQNYSSKKKMSRKKSRVRSRKMEKNASVVLIKHTSAKSKKMKKSLRRSSTKSSRKIK